MDDFIVSASPIASAPVRAKVLAKPAVNAPQQQSNFCTGKGYKAGCTITSYYYFNGQRVAMRVQSDANTTGTVTWLHGDMLGSASVATDAGGNKIAGSDARYMPYGEPRSGWAGSGLPTDRRFTGQISMAGGLIDFNARALDPLLGRFISADTIVPNPTDPQSLNRYSYTLANPLRYTDPNGHYTKDEIVNIFGTSNYGEVEAMFRTGGRFAKAWGLLQMLIYAKDGDVLKSWEGGGSSFSVGSSLVGTKTYHQSFAFTRNADGTLKNVKALESIATNMDSGDYFTLERFKTQPKPAFVAAPWDKQPTASSPTYGWKQIASVSKNETGSVLQINGTQLGYSVFALAVDATATFIGEPASPSGLAKSWPYLTSANSTIATYGAIGDINAGNYALAGARAAGILVSPLAMVVDVYDITTSFQFVDR